MSESEQKSMREEVANETETPETPRRKQREPWTSRRVLLVVLLLLLLFGKMYRAAKPVDDAYITFRYAENLVNGHGLAFNPGERVEGYTSFGQLLLMTPAAMLSKSITLTWAKALGVLAWALLVMLVWRHIRRDLGDRLMDRPEYFAIFFLSLCSPGVIWAWSGMETTLFAMMWFAAFAAHLGEYEKNLPPWRSALLTFLAALLHPEGILMAVVLGPAWLIPFDRKKATRALVYGAIAFGLFGLYWIWRWQYFDQFMPNTYAAKVGGFGGLLKSGGRYLLQFFYSGLIPLFLIYLLIRQWSDRRNWPRWLVIALSLVGILALYVVWIGGDYFPFQRFLLPAYAFCVVAIWRLWTDRRALIAARRDETGQAPSPPPPVIHGGEADEPARVKLPGHPMMWAMVVSLALAFWTNIIPGNMMQHKLLQAAVDEFAYAGLTVRSNTPESARIATIPIGALGYFSKRPIVDLMGLTDKEVAKQKVKTGAGIVGHEKYDYQRLLTEQRPDVIVQLPALFTNDAKGLEAWLLKTTLNPQQYTLYDYRNLLRRSYRLCWMQVPKKLWLRGRFADTDVQERGIYAYVLKTNLKKPYYRNWRELVPKNANFPFTHVDEFIEKNRRQLGGRTLGAWKFSGRRSAKTAPATVRQPAASPESTADKPSE